MILSKRQLRRIIWEQLSDRSTDPLGALAAAQEMGYDLNVSIEVDFNRIAIKDALNAYPGEFTYHDIRDAVKATGGEL